jgi:predicted nucleic acid-binding protein
MPLGLMPPDVVVAIDNDVLNDWRFRKPATLAAVSNYIGLVKAPPALTSVTVFEMMHGFENALIQQGTSDRLSRDSHHARELTRECTVLPFNEEAAEIAAYMFPRLSKKERKNHCCRHAHSRNSSST